MPQEPEEGKPAATRRLAVVMFLDMVGYSAMMAKDEAQAMNHVKALEMILATEIPAAGGRLVKFMGDGSMAEFPTAIAAVNCSRNILKAIATGYASDRPEDRYQVRIGLHLGEVMEEKGDLFGDAVNIAARIQPLADPNGIAMSEVVQVQIKNQITLMGTFIPARRLKNIPEPVDVFLAMPSGEKYPVWFLRKNRGVRHGVMTGTAILTTLLCVWAGSRHLMAWFGPSRTVNFPFPQNITYRYGSKVANRTPAQVESDIQSVFNLWRKKYLIRKGAPPGTWRVKMEDGNTVSESIGFAMLVLVAMDNRYNRTQDQFDGLWKYHQSFLDERGMMNWLVDASGKIAGGGASTATEMDIAMALLLAHRQWCTGAASYYLTEALTLIDKIRRNCFEPGTNYQRPGDNFGGSDRMAGNRICPANMAVFGMATRDPFWTEAINVNMAFIERCRSRSPAGLVPQMADQDGNPVTGESYDFGAWPTLWRFGLDYLWFGPGSRTTPKMFLSHATAFAINKSGGNPREVRDSFTLDGNPLGTPGWTTGLGGFGIAAQATEEQDWLNSLYAGLIEELRNPLARNYSMLYDLLNMLTITGNFPNMWDVRTTDDVGGPPRGVGFDSPLRLGTARNGNMSSSTEFVVDQLRGRVLKFHHDAVAATEYLAETVPVGQNWGTCDTLCIPFKASPPRLLTLQMRDSGNELWECVLRLRETWEEYRIPFEAFKPSASAEGRMDGILDLLNVPELRLLLAGPAGTVWMGSVTLNGVGSPSGTSYAAKPFQFESVGKLWKYEGDGGKADFRIEPAGAPDGTLRISFSNTVTSGFWGVGMNVHQDLRRYSGLRVKMKSVRGVPVALKIGEASGEDWLVNIKPSASFKEYILPFNIFYYTPDAGKKQNGIMELSMIENMVIVGISLDGSDTIWISSIGLTTTASGRVAPPEPAVKAASAASTVPVRSAVLDLSAMPTWSYSGYGGTIRMALEPAGASAKALRFDYSATVTEGYYGVGMTPDVRDWRPYASLAVRIRSANGLPLRIMIKDSGDEVWTAILKPGVNESEVPVPLKSFKIREDFNSGRRDGILDLAEIKEFHFIQPEAFAGPAKDTVRIFSIALVK